MANFQLLPKCNITSNSNFYYKDEISKEKKIRLSYQPQINFQHRNNIIICEQIHSSVKNIEKESYSAFEKAEIENNKTEEKLKEKHEILEKKRTNIENFVKIRNQKTKDKLEIEKNELKETLVRIIRQALRFSKESTPMISMIPSKLTNTMNIIREERGLLNISTGSLNISHNSNASITSIHKYESNAFLKALGLDLKNLNPNNIKIDIDRAYSFIKNWKVKNEDISQVIRFKVVNEIMNVEERRSVQKLKKLNTKINKYIDLRKPIIKTDESDHSVVSILKDSTNNNKKMISSKSDVKINKKPEKKLSPGVNSEKKIVLPIKKPLLSNKKKLNYNMKKECNEKKKKVILNAHKHVEKLLEIISQSEETNPNQQLLVHFNNIKYNKQCDMITRKLIGKNNISAIDFIIPENVK